MNITFLDGYTLNPGDISWAQFETLGNFTAYERTEPCDIPERAKDADILIVNKTQLQEAHFAALPNLKLVCVAAAGYDALDVEAARRHGIPVCNAAGYGNMAVAQMVVAHLLNVTNRVGHYAGLCREGYWSQSRDFCCWNDKLTELTGKRVTIVGFGNIGSTVAAVLRPFGVKLFAVTSKEQSLLPADVARITMEEAFAESDVVSLNCPLSATNREFVNAELLAHCKPGLILINTARGRLVRDADVAEALRSGRLGAYSADVLTTEPPAADNPLLAAPRAYITPHIAWATEEARRRIIDIIEANIRAFLNGTPQNVVN